MKKVYVFTTTMHWSYYFYFNNRNLYLLTTSSIFDLFIIPLNIDFNNQRLSSFKINDEDFCLYKDLLKNAKEVDYKKYFYNDFTGDSYILDMPHDLFYKISHFPLYHYEYLKLFAKFYNREEKLNHILLNI
jgi:hypothetical protein